MDGTIMEKKSVGRPKKYTDVEIMQEKIEEYFSYADKGEHIDTVEGLAYWLDMDRESILNYEKDEQFFGTIKKAKARILSSLQEMAATGGYNATMAIFNLKNNYGYADQHEIVQENTHKGALRIEIIEDTHGD